MNDRRRKGEKTGRWQWSTSDILVCEFCRSVCLYPGLLALLPALRGEDGPAALSERIRDDPVQWERGAGEVKRDDGA